MPASVVRLEGVHCVLTIERPREGVVLVTFVGTDVGEFGDAPFREIASLASDAPVELFIDARGAKAASVDVSGDWARWMRERRDRLVRVHMLTGSRFVELSAAFVRRFAGLDREMRLYVDPVAFEDALRSAPNAPGS